MLWLRALYLHRCVLLLARFKTLVSPRRRGLSLRARVRGPNFVCYAAYVVGFINLKPDAPSVFVLKKRYEIKSPF